LKIMESVPIIDMRDTPHASTKLRAAALIGVGSFGAGLPVRRGV